MQLTPNLGLEAGPFATDGGQEGAMKRNLEKIDTAIGAVGAVTWDTISGKPPVVAAGADEQAARDSIGAGTSNLVIGTNPGTAMAGDTPIPPAPLPGNANMLGVGIDTEQRTWTAKMIADYVTSRLPPA